MRTEKIGNATLYCGDYLEVLPEIGVVGCVVTDPPYMLNCSSDHSGKLNPWADLCNGSVFISTWVRLVLAKIKDPAAIWIFSNWRGLPAFQKAGFDCGVPLESLLVWDKQWIGPGMRGLRPGYELVGFYPANGFCIQDRGVPDIWIEKWSAFKPHGHPAEKPERLISRLLEISVPVMGSVLDPFMGSGTTGVAAIQHDMPFIGIEIDEKWFDIACRRIEKAWHSGSLLREVSPCA